MCSSELFLLCLYYISFFLFYYWVVIKGHPKREKENIPCISFGAGKRRSSSGMKSSKWHIFPWNTEISFAWSTKKKVYQP